MIADLKPYPEYKESGLPWVGTIPSHWDIKRGKAVFKESQLAVRDADEIVTCFRDGQVTLRRNRRTSGFMMALYESGYQGVRKGQLVIHAMDAFAGAVGVSESSGKCTPEYIVVDPRTDAALAGYFAQLMRFAARQKFILVSCPAVRERAPRFRYPNFGAMQMPLPPASEQAAIVRFLDWANGRLDRAIRAKRKVIALLNEQKQAIIHRAVTRGLDPSVPLKPSGIPWLGDIPQHWEVMQLRQLLSFGPKNGVSPNAPGTGGVLSFSISAIRDGGVRIEGSEKFVALDRALIPGLRIRKGDILLVRGNGNVALVGKCGLVDQCPDDCVYPDILMKLRPTERMGAEFLVSAINSGYVSNQASMLAKTSNGAFKVSGATVRSFLIAVPPVMEQQTIAASITQEARSVGTAISRLEREIELLREYRTRLVADVVTGKLDVREAAARLPDEAPSESALDDADTTSDIEADDEEVSVE